jgi:hypothetical protein
MRSPIGNTMILILSNILFAPIVAKSLIHLRGSMRTLEDKEK